MALVEKTITHHMMDRQDLSDKFQAVGNAACLAPNPKESLSDYIYRILFSARWKYPTS